MVDLLLYSWLYIRIQTGGQLFNPESSKTKDKSLHMACVQHDCACSVHVHPAPVAPVEISSNPGKAESC